MIVPSKVRLFSPRSLAFGMPAHRSNEIIEHRTNLIEPNRGDDRMATTTSRMKITYATLSADNEELQAAFDAAVERVRGQLGRSYPMLMGT